MIDSREAYDESENPELCELCNEENDLENSDICSDCDFLMHDVDGQPDEYTEWQDYMGGDEYYDHSEASGDW
jgi:hypothetical protein